MANRMSLRDCCTIIAGQSPESKYYNQNKVGIPFFQGKADFGALYPTARVYCSKPIRIAEEGDILLSVRAPVGATNLAPFKCCIGRGLTAIRPNETLNKKYLLYFLRYYEAQLSEKGTGTTFKAITQQIVKAINLPVLSLSLQKQIVTKIEKLFSKLDKAVDTLQTIQRQVAVYRQAVLKKAFSKVENYTAIQNISTTVTSGSRGWAKYYRENGSAFIRIGNLTRTGIDILLNNVQHVQLPEKAEGMRTKLCIGDVLVSITADLGSIGLVTQATSGAYINQHIAMIRFSNPKQGKMLAWYLRSEHGQKELLANKRGGGKLGLGLDDIRNAKVPKIDNYSAENIVANIESQMTACDNIERTVNTALQQAAALRQSILKQAFEGELIS